MKNVRQFLYRLFVNGGLSDNNYKNVKTIVRQANYAIWQIISILVTAIFICLFLYSASQNNIAGNAKICILCMAVFACCSLLLNFKISEHSGAVLPLVYFMHGVLLFYAGCLGLQYSQYVAVSFMVLLIAVPFLTTDRPYRMLIFLTASTIIFTLFCRLLEEGEVRLLNAINAGIYYLIAVFLYLLMTYVRMKGYHMQYMMQEESLRDSLTHVRNTMAYGKFKIFLDEQIRDKKAESFALVLCDVNRLKVINDSFGHERGDIYLKKNCEKICEIFSHSPVYRIGGDEFLVYLIGSDYEKRYELMQKTQDICNLVLPGEPDFARANFSAGIAEYDPSVDTKYSDIFKRADHSMYECKKSMHLREKQGPQQQEAVLPEKYAKTTQDGSCRILVIEDDAAMREKMKSLLEDQYRIFDVENGEAGLAMLQTYGKEISLILLSVDLPMMDGYLFLENIRKNPLFRVIPTLAMTERKDANTEAHLFELGAKDVMHKPVNSAILLSRILNLIRFTESASTLTAVEYDELTGIHTKEAFYYYADHLLHRNPDTVYDLYISDIENYRLFIRKYGKSVGNDVLCKLAKSFKEKESQHVLSGRFGIDMFVCMIPHREEISEKELLETWSQEMRQVLGPDLPIKCKFGVYLNVNHQEPITISCEHAYTALKTIRHTYGKMYALYDKTIQDEEERNYQIEQGMMEAYEQDQFKVFYQPKHEVRTGKLIGAEALIRWVHPKYGFMAPNIFIPLFEKNGFISMADFYVWRRTVQNLRQWMDEGIPVVPISVNSSRKDFEVPDYLGTIQAPLKDLNVEPKWLHIEITESMLGEDMEHISENLKKCQKAGFRVEMDDFGAGYSSLQALSYLPLDVLKLDMSLIRGIHDERKTRVLASAITLAKSLGMQTIAEGVETVEQLAFLRSVECDGIQGYFYSKPLPEEEFKEYLLRCAAEEPEDTIPVVATKSSGCYIIDEDYNVVDYNHIVHHMFPQLKMGQKCYQCLMDLDEPCDVCPVKNGIKGPHTYLDPIRGVNEIVDAVDMTLADGKTGHALILATIEK